MSNNDSINDYHDLNDGFHGDSRLDRHVQPDHTGPAIPGFTRTPGSPDGAFTTIFESVRNRASGMYDPEAENY